VAVRYPVEYECGVRLGAALARIEAEKHLSRARDALHPAEQELANSMFMAAAAVERAILAKIGCEPIDYPVIKLGAGA
jgi:HEPN domain-containing protein